MNNFEQIYYDVVSLTEQYFPDATSSDHILKMKHEADEILENPTDLVEYSDCFIALLAAVNKTGYSLSEFLKTTREKIEINKNRTWIKNADGTFSHKK